VVSAIIVMAANKFDGRQEVVLYAVGTGLSIIPASLVVVLTITMAVGVKNMVAQHVIVRKLDALEALGAVQVPCINAPMNDSDMLNPQNRRLL
jgi:P-type Na+/K+ transporter